MSLLCVRRFILIPVVLALVAIAPDSIHSQVTFSGFETRITNNLAGQYDPAISGNLIVYTDNRGADMDVWYYDLTTGTEAPVTVATGDQELTDVSNGLIVFTDYQTTDVLLFDVSIGVTTNLTAASGSVSLNPAIGQSLVAWEDRRVGNTDIWARIAGQPEVRVSSTTRDDRAPAVNNGVIVWQSCLAGICDIYAYDWASGSTHQVTATEGDERRPDVWNGKIVYEGRRGADADIYLFDLALGTEQQLARPGDQINANISGDFVAFEELVTGVSHIVLWHVPSGQVFDLTGVPTSSSQFLNDIDGNRIVYTDDRYGQLDIFMYEFQLDMPPPTPEYDFVGFLPPIANAPAVNTVKFGRTVPVKWQLLDAGGNFITDLAAVESITFRPVTDFAEIAGVEIDAEEGGSAGLRYDVEANQFVFNWKTDASACGKACVLTVRLADGQEVTANFAVK